MRLLLIALTNNEVSLVKERENSSTQILSKDSPLVLYY